jgi:phage shock protein B
MTPESIMGLVLGVLGMLLILGAALIVMVVWAIKSLRGNGGGGDEAKLMQELYQGLSRLEDRVESLETILLDRKDKNP